MSTSHLSPLMAKIDQTAHPVWADRFNEELRQSQLEDDLFAGKSVTGVLFAVVLGGTLLMVATVLICLL